MGHFAGSVLPGRANKPCQYRVIPTPQRNFGPQCQKAYHWAKDSRSKFHKDGTTPTSQVQGSNFSQFSSVAQSFRLFAPLPMKSSRHKTQSRCQCSFTPAYLIFTGLYSTHQMDPVRLKLSPSLRSVIDTGKEHG